MFRIQTETDWEIIEEMHNLIKIKDLEIQSPIHRFKLLLITFTKEKVKDF